MVLTTVDMLAFTPGTGKTHLAVGLARKAAQAA
jgi:DNA helicase TIP49 (TBP-interacting protein)